MPNMREGCALASRIGVGSLDRNNIRRMAEQSWRASLGFDTATTPFMAHH